MTKESGVNRYYAENGTVYDLSDESVKIAFVFNNGSVMNLPADKAEKIADIMNETPDGKTPGEVKTRERIFIEHYEKRSGKVADETVMHHMKYCLDAMKEYASQFKGQAMTEVKSASKIAEECGITFGLANSREQCLKAMEKYAFQFKGQTLTEDEIEEKIKLELKIKQLEDELESWKKEHFEIVDDAAAIIQSLHSEIVEFNEWSCDVKKCNYYPTYDGEGNFKGWCNRNNENEIITPKALFALFKIEQLKKK